MLPFPVVEHLDVLKAGGLHFGMGSITNAMNPFVLEAIEPAFSWRVDAPMSRRKTCVVEIGQQ